jgi:type I restriction enzyme S subunit
MSGYAFKSKKYTREGKYVVVKIGNIKQFKFDFRRDFTKTNEIDESILCKYLLRRGDCLITLTGSRGKRDYGFVVMIKAQENYLLNQRVAALRFNLDRALPEFYQYYLSSFDYRNQFFSYETGNVGQGNVGIKALIDPLVVCPNLDEQRKIVLNIESYMTVCDNVEKAVDDSLQQAESMRQSILKKAFEGGL